MAKKKQRGFKMFNPGGPLVIPQSAKPSYMAPATNLSQAPTPNIAQPMQGAQATAIGLSSIGGVLQGVTGLYQTMAGNLSVPKIQEQDFTSGSKEELLSKATDFKGYEMPKTDAVSSGLGGAASGAAAGTAIAPGIGTVIGAGVGLVGGAVSSIFGNSKRKRAKRRAERAAMNNINAQNTELTEDSIYSSLSSQLADGGDLYDDTSRENRGKLTAQTDNTYVEKPRVEEPVEQSVNGVKWSDLDFRTQMRNRGNLVDGYPTEKGLEIVSPEFDIISGVRGITNLLPKTQTFYHGSPVRFNKFNTQFIGSGEGGSKAMKGINLWPDNHFGAAPKFANIRSSDAPLHLGRASKEISGELNPTIYKVRGRNLNIYSSNTSKGLDQQELVNLGYDGFSNGKQYTIFPESVNKLKIKKHYSIPEFVKTHKKIDSWVPWSTDINKMNNILELAGSSKRFYDILLNSIQQKTKALGGSLTHSGDFSNGVTLFENGGTHEENPLGGIPQGYNENGELNLVEQGETKWKDYIFSDRNKLSKAERFNLPGILNNRTFSSAAKTIQKESEERPLDLISKRGLNKQMDYLMSAQEEHNAISENTNQFKSGGQMKFKSNKRVPGNQGVSINGNPKTVKHAYGDWLRYAPVASNVISLASDIASTPETIQTSKIEAPLLTEKMSYDPIDQEYLTNKLTSNYANLADKIQGSSGGNRGVANASMIAAMNNLYDAYGDTAIKSKEYNRDMLSKTLEFNRATSQANAQMRMAADQYNANAEDRMIATNAANRAARRNAIREQIAGLGENLGAIGTEQRWMDLAPKLFRGYKSNGDYDNKDKNNQTSDNSVISLSEDSMSKVPAKAWSKRNRKAKEVKNG